MINLHQLQSTATPIDNHYKLINKIGGGAFSEVWLAEDLRSQVKVAIKIYSAMQDMDDEGIEMFRNEFSLVCNLNHTNILKPFTFDIFQGCPYIVLPFCENGSASKHIDKMSEDELWNFAKQVAAGLSYIHRHNIIHQDIKPGNILINSDNQYLITDFGISTVLRNTIRNSVNDRSAGSGTTHYMSFECFGTKPQNVIARDIWAFGAMLYEMMTGDVPFGEYGGLTQNAQNGDIPPINAGYSEDLKNVVYKCLALNPWNRPSADEVLEMIRQHEEGTHTHIDAAVHKTPSRKIFIIAACFCVVFGLGTFAYHLFNKEPTKDMTIAANPNDSIVLAKVYVANNIVKKEKEKNDIKNIEEDSLCKAAEIYNAAIKMNASDSILKSCKDLWTESQQTINQSYSYLYNKGIEYSEMGAVNAAKQFGNRSSKLKKYTTTNNNAN